MWNMTKNGFIFLVMGFTGKLAAQFKEHYISAFDWMAEQLIATRPAHALTHDELRDLAWCWRAADKMWLLAKEVEDLLYSTKHNEAPNCYSIVREYSNTLAKAKVVLINHTRDLPPALYADEESNWARVLRPLHGQPARPPDAAAQPLTPHHHSSQRPHNGAALLSSPFHSPSPRTAAGNHLRRHGTSH